MDMDSHGYNQSEDDLWNQIVEYVDNHDIVMAGTPGSNDSYTNADGLVQGHAYNVLGYAILSDGTKLIKMQNPW